MESAAAIRLELATAMGEMSTAQEKRNNIDMLQGELRELIASRGEDAERCRREISAAGEAESPAKLRFSRVLGCPDQPLLRGSGVWRPQTS